MHRSVILVLIALACRSAPALPEPNACGTSTVAIDTIRIVAPDSLDVERLAAHQVRPPCAAVISRHDRGLALTRPARPVLRLDWLSGADPRDALDGGADALLTGDPRTIDYARAGAEHEVLPLPWDRTYVIVLKRGTGITWAEGPAVWRDAMPGDAQPAQPPFWWQDVACPDSTPAIGPVSQAPRMVFELGDVNGRGLAERFVARGASLAPPDQREKVVGLDRGDLAAAVAGGADYAVVAIPRVPTEPCAALAALGLWGRTRHEVIPMLDTRLHLIVRRGRFGVSLDGDGIPVFDP